MAQFHVRQPHIAGAFVPMYCLPSILITQSSNYGEPIGAIIETIAVLVVIVAVILFVYAMRRRIVLTVEEDAITIGKVRYEASEIQSIRMHNGNLNIFTPKFSKRGIATFDALDRTHAAKALKEFADRHSITFKALSRATLSVK